MRQKIKKLIEEIVWKHTTLDGYSTIGVEQISEEVVQMFEFGAAWPEQQAMSEYEYLKGLQDRLREILDRKDIDGFQKEVRIRELIGK